MKINGNRTIGKQMMGSHTGFWMFKEGTNLFLSIKDYTKKEISVVGRIDNAKMTPSRKKGKIGNSVANGSFAQKFYCTIKHLFMTFCPCLCIKVVVPPLLCLLSFHTLSNVYSHRR